MVPIPNHLTKETASFNYSYDPTSNSWLPTNSADWSISVAENKISGYRLVRKFGRNPDIDTATDPEDVWYGGDLMNWVTTPSAISINSSYTGDVSSGNGAINLVVEGLLSGTWAQNVETVALKGRTTATTTGKYTRVNRAYISGVNTYHGSNLGSLTGTINSQRMFTIPSGAGQTQIARYTVPSGKTAYLAYVALGISSSKVANITMYKYENANDVTPPYNGAGKRVVINFDGVGTRQYFAPPVPQDNFPEMTDLWWTVDNVSANDTSVDVNFGLWVIDN